MLIDAGKLVQSKLTDCSKIGADTEVGFSRIDPERADKCNDTGAERHDGRSKS